MGPFLKSRTILLILMGGATLALGCGRSEAPQVEKKAAANPLPEKTVAVRLWPTPGVPGKTGLSLAAITLGEARPPIDAKDPTAVDLPVEPEPELWSAPQPLQDGLKNLTRALLDRQTRDGVRLILQIEVDQKIVKADEVAQVVAACKAAGIEKLTFIAPLVDLVVEDIPEIQLDFTPKEKVEVPLPDPILPIGILDPKEDFQKPRLDTLPSGSVGGYGFPAGMGGSTRTKKSFWKEVHPDTEAAVGRALQWLAAQQQRDGSWSLGQGKIQAEPIRATALALLSFVGAGRNHHASPAHQSKTVLQGFTWLLKKQNKVTGDLGGTVLEQALAAWVLCEAYNQSMDPALRRPAEAALKHLLQGQQEDGGWSETRLPGADEADFPWIVLALQSGRKASLNVALKPALLKAQAHLNSVRGPDTGAGHLGKNPTPTATAAQLLCLYHLVASNKDLGEIARRQLAGAVPGKGTLLHDFFVTQTMHHLGGDENKTWTKKVREHLAAVQTKVDNGKSGWWDEANAAKGERLIATTLAVLQLETPYRFLTIWEQPKN